MTTAGSDLGFIDWRRLAPTDMEQELLEIRLGRNLLVDEVLINYSKPTEQSLITGEFRWRFTMQYPLKRTHLIMWIRDDNYGIPRMDNGRQR